MYLAAFLYLPALWWLAAGRRNFTQLRRFFFAGGGLAEPKKLFGGGNLLAHCNTASLVAISTISIGTISSSFMRASSYAMAETFRISRGTPPVDS